MSWTDYIGGALAGPVGDYLQNGGNGGFGGALGDAWGWLNQRPNGPQTPYLASGSPYNTGNPYAGGYNSLVSQLQGVANGTGPSQAGQAWNQANQNAMATQMSMGSGGSNAGAARQAAQNIGNIQQGNAAGYAQAKTGEEIGAMGQLGNVLQGASNSDFNYQNANQQAWLNMLKAQLGQNTNMQQMSGLVQAGGQAGKMLGM